MLRERKECEVRAGAEADLEALTELYNHYIRETPITFDIDTFTPAQRLPWLLSHPEDGPYRLLVARDVRNADGSSENRGTLLGYATSSAFRPKAAYSTSVEVSVYCAPEAAGLGIGTLLYERLFQALEGEDVHRAYAGITQPNEASARLHARFGFRPIGTFTEAGRKFDRYWDIVWYEKKLRGSSPGGSKSDARVPGALGRKV
ncbi:GNAT family N-acetyltransferase [Streptomyces albipurpureus]|uniref:GNAT family N-acetyltransferase n=1 Tax=Streptomyces albipurpureus TaxID=2897419 RepID=A0ABT0UXT3_9ACTN|nr:GNAT family N-acetyltransferase [Streptomyces sp. CWNU-1]MCM2393387.1 GNAT family N-acetyltransferase [Streptomyces sp. CWNU-1]